MVKSTGYFRDSVMMRRPYLREDWIVQTLGNPIRVEVQTNGRIRYWALVAEMDKYLRVVTEPDGETVHNAFSDRRFRP
jgi:hypothetical protein